MDQKKINEKKIKIQSPIFGKSTQKFKQAKPIALRTGSAIKDNSSKFNFATAPKFFPCERIHFFQLGMLENLNIFWNIDIMN